MKVFISWSGIKSEAVADALRRWLPDVIQTVRPWMSRSDIDAGARWSADIGAELAQTNFGIICLTKSNCNAPWILFEAGALAKTIANTFVCPYLIDLNPSDIPNGPLTQFQAKRANDKETWELVYTLNKSLQDNALSDEQLKRTFDRWWPDLKRIIDTLPSEQAIEEISRSSDDMVREVLDIVRELSRYTLGAERKRLGEDLLFDISMNPEIRAKLRGLLFDESKIARIAETGYHSLSPTELSQFIDLVSKSFSEFKQKSEESRKSEFEPPAGG